MNITIHKILDITIGNIFGKDITCREPVEPCDYYQPGTLVEIGRTTIRFFKKFIIPGGLCGAVPAIKPEPPCPSTPVECNNDGKLIRPSELPLYVHEHQTTKSKETIRQEDGPRELLENGFGTVRQSLKGVTEGYSAISERISDSVSIGMEHSKVTLDYLREESNLLPRIGAVALGGLTGLIFSLRGGKFKRFIYSTTGATTVATVCYPNEAQDAFTASKHYINIVYNFIYGVKPGDANQKEIKWPELPKFKVPTSFSDFIDLATKTGSSVASTVGSLISDATGANKEQPPKETSPEKK